MSSSNSQRTFWNAYIERYAGLHGLTTDDARRVTGRFARRTVATLLRHQRLDELRRHTVLDFGCGTGRLAALIAPLCRRLICLDMSPAMIALAQTHLASHDNVEFHVADARELPRADFAYAYATVTYARSPEELWTMVRAIDRAASSFCLQFHKYANEHPDPARSIENVEPGDLYAVSAYRPTVKTLKREFPGPDYWVERHRPDVRGREPFLYKGKRLGLLSRLINRY